MFYYSYDVYMNWYNWYYGIKDEPIVLKEESDTFSQATLNEAIIASINDPPPPPSVSFAELPKKLKKKKKNKKRCF